MTTTKKARSETDAEHKLKLLRDMLLIRRFEEKCVELYSTGKIRGFLHLYIGEEAVAVGAIPCLRADDKIVSTYREHGHALVRGIPAGAVMAEMFGKVNGCSRGRGGSMHLFDAKTNFYGGNAIVGGGLPLAVGFALADKMHKKESVTACFFGDGAVAEGEFHESMNLAELWDLPVLFICENNLYAMGTALSRHQSQTDIARKADAYGITAKAIDGMDVFAVEEATKEALDSIRKTGRPYLLEFRTYRFRAHSMYDPELYRNKAEVEEWKKRCPIANFERLLREQRILSDKKLSEIENEVVVEVENAIAFAEEGELEPVEDLKKYVYTQAK